MERVEKEIIFLDNEKKLKYLDERIDWLDNYGNILEVTLSDQRLDPNVICEENKQQIIDENDLKPGDWDDVRSIIPPEDWIDILYRLYEKEVKKIITKYRQNEQDKRLNFLSSELDSIYDFVNNTDLYNHNVDPFEDFISIEKAIKKRLSDINSLKKGCQNLELIVRSKINSEGDGTNDKAMQDQKTVDKSKSIEKEKLNKELSILNKDQQKVVLYLWEKYKNLEQFQGSREMREAGVNNYDGFAALFLSTKNSEQKNFFHNSFNARRNDKRIRRGYYIFSLKFQERILMTFEI